MIKEKSLKTLILVAVPLLLIDMAVKYWVATNLPTFNWLRNYFPYGGIDVVNNFHGIYFSVIHATNKGAAWGVLSSFQDYLLIARIVLILALSIYLIFFNKRPSYRFPYSLIITGAIGNVIDYFIYGHVIDMWNIQAWGFNFPIFNMADIYVTIGIVILFFQFMFEKKGNSNHIDYSSF